MHVVVARTVSVKGIINLRATTMERGHRMADSMMATSCYFTYGAVHSFSQSLQWAKIANFKCCWRFRYRSNSLVGAQAFQSNLDHFVIKVKPSFGLCLCKVWGLGHQSLFLEFCKYLFEVWLCRVLVCGRLVLVSTYSLATDTIEPWNSFCTRQSWSEYL